jgi:hypothetical protein
MNKIVDNVENVKKKNCDKLFMEIVLEKEEK